MTLILPDCRLLTKDQTDALKGYLEAGGWIASLGTLGANLDEETRRAILEHERTIRVDDARAFEPDHLPLGPQGSFDAPVDWIVKRGAARQGRGDPRHPLRLRRGARRVPGPAVVGDVVRPPRPFFGVTPVSPGGGLEAALKTAGGEHRLRLRSVPLYGVLWLR